MLPSIIKIGGSMLLAPDMPAWITALRGRKVIVVVGGGPFADTARSLGLSADHGHQLAVRAMEMSALSIHQRCDKTGLIHIWSDVATCWQQGLVPLWQPSAMLKSHWLGPNDWQATSDSLAAWLAMQWPPHTSTDNADLFGRNLLLVKSARLPQRSSLSVRDLQEQGIIDMAFGHYAKALDGVWCCHASDHRQINNRSSIGTGLDTTVYAPWISQENDQAI